MRGILLVGLVVGLVGCSSDDTYLPALLADPMASYEADGIELIDRDTQGQGKDFIWGKTIKARVVSEYRILDPTQVEAALADAVSKAELEGFEMEQGTGPTAMVGYKDVGVGEARLLVALVPEDPLEPDGSAVILRVSLAFNQQYE